MLQTPQLPAGYLPKTTATRQFADLVLAPVDSSKLQALRELLATVREETISQMRGANNVSPMLPFRELEGLHYARLVLIDDQPGAHPDGPLLAFATDYDGPEGADTCQKSEAHALHLRALVDKLGPGLERIFQCCRGYRTGKLADYLERHQRATATFYVGSSGRSRNQILWEASLRRAVEESLREVHATDPAAIRREVRARLEARFALPSFPEQPDLEGNVTRAKIVAGLALTLILLGMTAGVAALLPAGAGWALRILGGLAVTAALSGALIYRFRWLETHDPQFEPSLTADTHRQFAEASRDENEFLQNQLSHVVDIKPGFLRWLLIRVVFVGIQLLAINRYNRGKLGNIPSIHMARWVLGPRRHVIFFSNFDSSWPSYLGDFIDQASAGLTAVWSNTLNYPRSTWLIEAGADDAQRFLAWTRHYQIPSQVWYAAYPGLSIVNVNTNTEIRRGLADFHALDATTWLAYFRNVDRLEADHRYGAERAEQAPLNLPDIQGIVLRGYGHMPEAAYLLFKVREASPALRSWIGRLPITSAEEGKRKWHHAGPLVNVAFSYQGLRALGLQASLCDQFSTPFVQGSDHPYRTRVNGDLGEDAPEHWNWGAGERTVHLVLLVFAPDKPQLRAHLDNFMAQAERVGLSLIAELEGTTLSGRKEHFGFRDGIAQPIIAGSGDVGSADNTIAAGEVLLGQRDAYGNVVPSPQSEEGFAFGHNGSYLVLRQLEQDVPAFWRFCSEQGEAPVRFASKMVGRWPSGAPLVRHPDADPGADFEDEDDFGYLEAGEDNDRYGSRCPFGSHIRRSNPRDWGAGETKPESLGFSNRHRIVRRGRPYGEPLDLELRAERMLERAEQNAAPSAGRGLNFLCFNANLERQFEFVQQQWCNNPKFGGQNADADPLLGLHRAPDTLGLDGCVFTQQGDVHGAAPRRAMHLQRFVRVKGSGYFFVPSLSAIRLLDGHLTSSHAAPELEQVSPDEQLHIDNLIESFQTKLTRDYAHQRTLRDAHPKQHGCVAATLEILEVPAHLRHGLFAAPRTYCAWARFSNQSNTVQSDSTRDTRGLALKLLDVPGAKLLDGEEASPNHDFIFLSTPRFVTSTLAEFDGLFGSLVKGTPALGWFMLCHLHTAYRHFSSLKRFASPLEIEYFSVVPYLIGPRAVKYQLKPRRAERSPIPANPADDYLREAMKRQLAPRADAQPWVFDLYAEEFADQERTPIEDPSIRWRPTQAPTHVASLSIAPQEFDAPERREFGDNLSFNPWRCLPEHRPLGSISRARRQVYKAMSAFRHDRNGVRPAEPSSADFPLRK